MEKQKRVTPDFGILRQKAEKILMKKKFRTGSQFYGFDMLRLIHELEVHQIELELLNEELMLAKEQAEAAAEKYVELYDFAPSGYFTLSNEGEILALNLCGSQMLGKERSLIKNSKFGLYVTNDTRPIFNLFLSKVFESRTKETCEISMSINGSLPIYVYLTGIVADNGEQCVLTVIDITGRKQSEESLKESDERNHNIILKTAMDGFMLTDIHGALLEVNEIYCRMSGYSVPELLAMGITNLEADEAANDTANRIQKIMVQGEDRFETRHRRKDGSIFDVEINVQYHPGKGGRFVAFLHDITERKLTEENLRQSEERYKSLFQGNQSVMLLIDPETGEIKDANPAASLYYGWTHSEMCRKTILELNRLSKEEVMAEMQKAKEETCNHFFFKHLLANGEVRDVEIYSGPIKFNDLTLLYTLVHDITERQQTEEALMENERLLRESQAVAHIGSYITDLKAQTWKGTFEIYKILGIDETYTQTVEGLKSLMHPDAREQFFGYTPRVEVENKRFDHEFKIIRFNDGEERWVHGLGEFDYDSQPKPVRIIGTLRDITKRKQAEEALMQLNEKLEDRVRERTVELLNVTVEVEERERNRFSRELHDGLGPLLSTIKLYFQWLSETKDADKIKIITENGNNYIEKAIQTSHEVSLGLNSLQLNNLGYVDTVIDFTQSINDMKKLTINFTFNSKDRFSYLLETTLYRITTELINNTVKYANASHVEITYNYYKAKNQIIISFQDNGVGFDIDGAKKKSKGLGLMNIQNRIQILGGVIKIETGIGKGMKAYIELPVNEKISEL